MRSFRTILPFLKENKWRYLLGILTLIVVDAASLIMPQVLRQFVDWAQMQTLTMDRVMLTAGAVLGIGVAISVGRFIWRTMLFGSARRLGYWLRDKLFQHYLSLDSNFYHKNRTGDLMAHATNDVQTVQNSMGGGVMLVVDSLFMTIMTVVMMIITVGLKTSAFALIALPFIAIAVSAISKPTQKRSRIVQNTFSDMTTEVQENLSGIRVIKATGIEVERSDRFQQVNELYRKRNVDLVKIDGLFDPVITTLSGFSFAIFLIYGAGEVLAGRNTIGDFVAVINYLYMIVWPMVALGFIANNFQRGIASMKRINEILVQKPGIKEVEHPVLLENPKGQLTFEDVSFRYRTDMPYVLEHVNLDVEPGTTLAIVGRTGSGKSTLIDLVMRLYDVSDGVIRFDGVDIRDLSLEQLRDAISSVPQTSFLFSKTIRDNIAFSSLEEVSEERIVEAAKFAQVHDDILAMPEGYDTVVGERGVTLSGGQKQRISIARAYLRNAPLMILDDALSAVDTETEDEILHHLRQHGKSLILISQRISTVKSADHIIVLEDGTITQEGTHEALMRDSSGYYRTLYDKQLLESELEADQFRTQTGGAM